MAARTYKLEFLSPYEAQTFLRRLVFYLKDVAAYRDEATVWVIDGSREDHDQRERIYQLAHTTGAQRAFQAKTGEWKL